MKYQLFSSPAAIKIYPGLFLVIFYMFQAFTRSPLPPDPLQIIGDLILLLLPVYLNLLVLFPVFLRQKKHLLYWITILVTVGITGFLPMMMGPVVSLDEQSLVINISNALVLVLLTTGYQYAIDSFHEKTKQRQIERRQLETELQLLRMQLNPHFLFNTLNNLYGLAISKSDRLPELMLKLSELLRYLHDETHKEKITLRKELAFVENYIELQKLRFSKKVKVEFHVEGNVCNLDISPALLINFIENGFKHTNIESPEAFVITHVMVQNNTLLFRVFNSRKGESKGTRKGSGLRNIQRRLDMLYTNSYSLDIRTGTKTYFVKLKLHLK